MRKQGTIARWDAGRGFGFIRGSTASADVFFHLRDLRGGLQPREGMLVTFEEIHVGGKGPRAMAVEAMNTTQGLASGHTPARSPARVKNQAAPRRRPQRQAVAPAGGPGFGLMLIVITAYAGLLLWAVWRSLLPWWMLPASFVLNLVAFWTYWVDKRAAQTGQWRTAESTLQLLALAGGWPGAWLAQQVLRHKSSKLPFRAVYWLMVLSHGLLLGAWLFWPPLRQVPFPVL
jgi:uncharacterized membrane protein YsdA (DUF1294 family)/cold shock CspA family protein